MHVYLHLGAVGVVREGGGPLREEVVHVAALIAPLLRRQVANRTVQRRVPRRLRSE